MYSLATLALGTALWIPATPQDDPTLVPAPGPVKHAGILHVATGAWTRRAAETASFGPDAVYLNTANSGYFLSSTASGGTRFVDDGGLPGTTNPDTFAVGANRDSYEINCVEILYCDLGAAGTSGWRMSFYDEYAPCTVPGQAPNGTVEVTGLPASGCWVVTLDLSGGSEFCMRADGGQTGVSAPFGWTNEYIGTDGTQPAGMALAGDPFVTDPGWTPGTLPRYAAGTYYGNPDVCGFTGYLTDDLLVAETAAGANCLTANYVGGGSCPSSSSTPYASFFLALHANVIACDSLLSTVYCQSNPNATGAIGQLVVNGSSDPLLDDATLRAFDLPPFSFGFFLVSQTQGFVSNPGGSQGNLCLGGSIGRFVGPGQIKSSGPDGEIELSTATNEWSTQAIPTPSGPFAASLGTTVNFQLWHREHTTIPTSNLTNGVEVNW